MKTQNSALSSVVDHLKGFPEGVQATLRGIGALLKGVAPGAQERLSYRIPSNSLGGALVYLAAFKNHISFQLRTKAVASFKNELAKYRGAKGSLRFSLDESAPSGLMRRIIAFGEKENSRAMKEARKSVEDRS